MKTAARAVAAIALATTLSGLANAGGIPEITESFDADTLDTSTWQLFQVKPYRHWRERVHVKTGAGSRAIRAKGGDVGTSCENPCQRSEIRLQSHLRAPYREHVFYGFSFQVRDEVTLSGSHRLVIGQWKGEDSGGSPFVAQRFDNRVFHVTVQDNDCRAVVAAADGDIESFLARQRSVDFQPPAFVSDPALYRCSPDLVVTCFVAQCRLPDPYERWTDMVFSVKGGRDKKGELEIWANGTRIVQVTGSIGNDDDGERQKFKFGIYRADRPETTTFFLDNFRQGSSYTAVDPATFPQ